MKKIYILIGEKNNISRVELARLTKLSRPTVSALVDELIVNGYVVNLGEGISEKRGRKPNLLARNESNFVVVFSWNKEFILFAIIDANNEIVHWEKRDVNNKGYIAVTKEILEDEIYPLIGNHRLLGVCVVVPSMIDPVKKTMISTVINLPSDKSVVDAFYGLTDGVPCAIFNDTACFAYAECKAQELGKKNVAFINMSKGVGAVLINNGKIFRGANGMTTQFGHFSIDPKGVTCTCGNKGCLEVMVGEMALYRRAQECGVSSIFATEQDARFERVGELAALGNQGAITLIDKLSDDLAFGIANLTSIVRSELIVIGGTGTGLGDYFLKQVINKIKAYGFPVFMNTVEVRYSSLNWRSELQGAAQYYIDYYFTFETNKKNDNLFIG